MTKSEFIAPDLTVRQVARAWPAYAPILDRYPTSRWNGRWSLQELGPFARDQGLDESYFLGRLSDAAGVPVQRHARTSRDASPVPLIFAAIALGITVGAGWGVGLLLRIAFAADYSVVPGMSVHVHGLAQLWGWMALFIFAVATHLLRQNSKHPPPVWLGHIAGFGIVAGILAFFAGLFEITRRTFPSINVIASSLLVLAALSFGVTAILSLWGRAQRPQLWHAFVIAMVAWLWTWAGTDLSSRIRHSGEALLTDTGRSHLIILPVLGFATNAIYGFGIRLIPGLLNLGTLRPSCFATTLIAHNIGFVLMLTSHRTTRIAGASLMLGSACVYLAGMDLLRSKPSRPIYGVDTRGHVLIPVAFFWLVVGLAMVLAQQVFPLLPHAYGGAWRHALTVGFVTTMILGVAQRIVPVFIRQPLASTRLMIVGGALIIIGNAGRVGLELATLSGARWTYRLMGITGLLELSALMLFALNLLLTMLARRRIYTADQPLTPDTRVREAVNARPEIQQRLADLGVTMFDDAPFIAPSMTFGALALAWGRRPEQLIAELLGDQAPASVSGSNLVSVT